MLTPQKPKNSHTPPTWFCLVLASYTLCHYLGSDCPLFFAYWWLSKSLRYNNTTCHFGVSAIISALFFASVNNNKCSKKAAWFLLQRFLKFFILYFFVAQIKFHHGYKLWYVAYRWCMLNIVGEKNTNVECNIIFAGGLSNKDYL